MKVPNLPERFENQSGKAREKAQDEHDEIKLSLFTSRLKNRFL